MVSWPSSSALSAQSSVTPSQWPSSPGLSPAFEGWPNALRIWGGSRYETGLAASLTMRGRGGFPFTTPDPSSDGAVALSSAAGWWGKEQCPRSVIVVAGDSPADAMAASVLSDPTGLSTEPYLERVAAADPLFYPVGGFSRVDTDLAPVFVTRSGRSGAKSLTVSTRYALQDLRSGGCRTARQAVIVGGDTAVHPAVEAELLSIGYNEIYRVAGENRYGTASAVALAMGTYQTPASVRGCDDASSLDGDSTMSFYANSVMEWRPTASTCFLLSNTVVLTDGIVGADALAAGWWTSFWQVPILLHNGKDELPKETYAALQVLDVRNIVILGGESRISQAVESQAVDASGANILRVAGADRYMTSFQTAKHFGGWWPTGNAKDFEGSKLCFAASPGPGSKTNGWADALGAGPWCGSAIGVSNPARTLGLANGPNPRLTEYGFLPKHNAVPLLLIPSGAQTLPVRITSLLRSYFDPSDSWCSYEPEEEDCAEPGFAVVFGGPRVVSDKALGELSSLMGGGPVPAEITREVLLEDLYLTSMDMTPVYRSDGHGSLKGCVERDSYRNARWLIAGKGRDLRVLSAVDLVFDSWYQQDHDGQNRSTGLGSPGCLKIAAERGETVWFRAVSAFGQASEIMRYEVDHGMNFAMSGAVFATPPAQSRGVESSTIQALSGETQWSFASIAPPVKISLNAVDIPVTGSDISVVLNRALSADADQFNRYTSSWSLETPEGNVSGFSEGEAVFANGVWFLRGRTTVALPDGTEKSDHGGFKAEIAANSSGFGDDSISWRIDSVVLP